MDVYEYWIGENVNYQNLWKAYENGDGYKRKFNFLKTHLIEIEFEYPPSSLPLFNQEVVYKTLKGYFHDLKKICLSREEYTSAGPLFIYEISRGSGIWTFLGELPYILLYGTTLTKEKIVGQKLENFDKKLKILKDYFGDGVRPDLFENFISAETPRDIEEAVNRLLQERIKDIRVSQVPFNGKIAESRRNLISLNSELAEDEPGKE